MGKKGDQMGPNLEETARWLLDQMGTIEGISSKKMFGGFGIFYNGKMFGMITAKGQCYLKAKNELMEHFVDNGSYKHSRMPYFSIPESILNDPKKLLDWTEKSIEQIE